MWHTPLEFDMDYTFGVTVGTLGALIESPEGSYEGSDEGYYIMNYLNGTSQYVKLNNTIVTYQGPTRSFKFFENILFMYTSNTFYVKSLVEGAEINFTATDEIFNFSKTITYANMFKSNGFYLLTIGYEDPSDFLYEHKLYVRILDENFKDISGVTFYQSLQHMEYGRFNIADVFYNTQQNKILLIGYTAIEMYGPSFLLYLPDSGEYEPYSIGVCCYYFSYPVEFGPPLYSRIGEFVGDHAFKTAKIFWADTSQNPILLNFETNYERVYMNFIEFDLESQTPLTIEWNYYGDTADIPQYVLVDGLITQQDLDYYEGVFIYPNLNFKIIENIIYLYVEVVFYNETGLDEFGDPIVESLYKKPLVSVALSTDQANPSTATYVVNDDFVSDERWGKYLYSAADIFLVGDKVKFVAARPVWEIGGFPPDTGSLNFYLIADLVVSIPPPPILAIFNKITPQYATHTDPTTTPPKQTPLQYITHTTFYNEPSTEPPTPQNLQIKISPKDLKNFASDDDDISFKVEFLNTLLETPNTTTRLTPISILPPSILQVSKSDWDNSNIGDVLVVSRHYENLPNDEFYTTYLQFKNNTFLILAKYEDNGKFYIGLDNAFPPYKNLANYLITVEKFSYKDILMLYYFHIRGNPLIETTQQLVYSTNETPERIYSLVSSLPIKYLQHLISHIVNLSPLIIEFRSLDHFEAGDYVLINEDIYFFTNGIYQIFSKTITPETNTYQCIKVNHKSFGQSNTNTRTGTRLYISNTYASATSNTPISSSDPTFYLTDKDLRTLTPKAGLFKYGGLLNSNWKILFDGAGKVATNTSVTTTISWGNNIVSGTLHYINDDLLFTPTSTVSSYPHQNEVLGLYENTQNTTTTVTQNTDTTNTNKTVSVNRVLRGDTYLVLTTSQLVAGNSTPADFSAFDIKIWKTTRELGENIAKSEFESSSPYATATVVANSPIGIGNASNASITNTISPNEKYIIQIKGVLSNTSKTNPTFLHVGSFTNNTETRFKAFS